VTDTSLAQAEHLSRVLALLEFEYGFHPQPATAASTAGCVRALDEDHEPFCQTHWADWPCPGGAS